MIRLLLGSSLLGGMLMAGVPELGHPRLLFLKGEEGKVRERIARDAVAATLHEAVVAEAKGVLKGRTCRYEIPDGKRLLRESRLAIHNVVHPAMLWRLGEGEEYRLRVIKELDAACALKDWNPTHFLDTAEMATAVAIGYDWLYPTLSAEQRGRYEEALIEKALKPAKKVYDSKGWWSQVKNNWSQVCGAGIGLAAAAVWEREPELCENLFRSGVKLVEGCGAFYRPDGVYPEGPGYWHYGTNYQVLMLAACASLGEKIEVEPALRKSGEFMLQMIGPTSYDFNFADVGSSRAGVTPAQCWVASHFQDAGQAKAVREWVVWDPRRAAGDRLGALSLLWLPAEPGGEAPAPKTFSMYGGEQPMAFLRNGWEKESAWLAIKGGTGAASHGHLDAGSFVYEAGGVRWFVDLGSDDYNMPGYFGKQRWEYFRLNNRSHNTLVIDGRLQEAPKEPCPIVDHGEKGEERWVTIDLGRAYRGQAEKVLRRATFDRAGGGVVLQDGIEKPVGAVRWAVVTDAEVKLEGAEVRLRKEGRTLLLKREDGGGGAWEVADAKPPTEREKQNEGYRVVSFTAPKADVLKLKVGWALVKE